MEPAVQRYDAAAASARDRELIEARFQRRWLDHRIIAADEMGGGQVMVRVNIGYGLVYDECRGCGCIHVEGRAMAVTAAREMRAVAAFLEAWACDFKEGPAPLAVAAGFNGLPPLHHTFGEVLARAIRRHGVGEHRWGCRRWLARQIRVNSMTVGRYISGEKIPEWPIAMAIARVLHWPPQKARALRAATLAWNMWRREMAHAIPEEKP